MLVPMVIMVSVAIRLALAFSWKVYDCFQINYDERRKYREGFLEPFISQY